LEGGHIFSPIATGAESSEHDDFSLSSLDGENVNGRLTSATFPDSQKSISKSLKPLVLLIGNDRDKCTDVSEMIMRHGRNLAVLHVVN